MRLMITTLALCVAALLGVEQASAGALQTPATASVVAKAGSGESTVQKVWHRRNYGYRYGYGYAAPYYGYYSYRPRYYYQPYAYYYPAPRYYGYYAAPAYGYYGYKRRHRDWDDDWDD